MKILNRLAIKNLKLNKKRTRATIIGIILSSILITAVATLLSSYQETMIEQKKDSTGDWHYEFINISDAKLEEIKNDKNVEKSYITQDVGYTNIEGLDKENSIKKYGYILGFTKEAIENININIIEGRMPQNENEIVIQRQMLKDLKLDWKIGDEISLEIGKRMLGEIQLAQEDLYSDEEQFVVKESKKYEIVGIMEHPGNTIEDYKSQSYTMITQMNYINENNRINIFVRYKNPNDVNISGKDNVNEELINLETNNLEEENIQFMYILAGIIMLLVVVMSVFCIRNSFEISITERVKEYGILASIGATPKQIKYNVFFEGFLLGIIANPIGICLGIFLVFIIIKLIGNTLSEQLWGTQFIFNVNILTIIMAIVINSLTIYWISKKSAKKASKISPIEAIRGNRDIKIERRKIKSSKLVKKIFGIGGDIAYKNLKRNGKKYKTTINSIIISLILFIAMTSFVQYSLKNVENTYEKDYNISVLSSRNYEAIKEISQNSNVKEYSLLRTGKLSGHTIKAVGEQEYYRFIKKLGLNYKDVKDKLIWINPSNSKQEELKEYQIDFENDFEKGDIIKEKINNKNVEIEVIEITTNTPMGMENLFWGCGIVSEEFWQNHKFGIGEEDNISIYINAEDTYKLEDWIMSNYSDEDMTISNQEAYMRSNKILWTLIATFLYILIGMITLISITNIFNAITTNMQLRQKEFAVLKSIGLTRKEFNRMINLESLFYGFKALIIGIPLGIGLSYLIYEIFKKNTNIVYILPLKTILVAVFVIYIFIWLIMKYSIKQINEQNIIETIRNDNI